MTRLALLVGSRSRCRPPAAPPRSPPPNPVGSPVDSLGAPWGGWRCRPEGRSTRGRSPPREGRHRCIGVDNVAGAQLFGDRAIELSMKNGQRYRLFLARECPALSFYQGFYYRRHKAGQLCAGRDVIGARSGGECPIASIIAGPPLHRPQPKWRTARQTALTSLRVKRLIRHLLPLCDCNRTGIA